MDLPIPKKVRFLYKFPVLGPKIPILCSIFFFREICRFWPFWVRVQEICTENGLFLKSYVPKTDFFWTKFTKKAEKSAIFGQKTAIFDPRKNWNWNHQVKLRSITDFQQQLKKREQLLFFFEKNGFLFSKKSPFSVQIPCTNTFFQQKKLK